MSRVRQDFSTSLDIMSTLHQGWFKNLGNVNMSRLVFKNLPKHFQYQHNGKSTSSNKVINSLAKLNAADMC